MSNIWFTSDTHFHHKNIVKGVSDWENKGDQSQRDFKTLEEHDEHIIAQFNKYVKQDDVLWHLGDWSFGGIEQIWNFKKRLPFDINLVYGNHDHHIENNRILPNVKRSESYGSVLVDGVPKDKEYPDYVEAWSLFSSTQHVYFGKIGKQTFFLSHYAHRVWNKSHHGVIHLYGHSHDSLDRYFNTNDPRHYYGKSMDVGIDSAKRVLGEYRPFHIDEILKIMNGREIYMPDHHNSKTN